jgi:hypothetical protein
MHAAVRLPFVSLSLRSVVRFDAETKHTQKPRNTRSSRDVRVVVVVVVVVVFSFKEHVHVYSARVGMCVVV